MSVAGYIGFALSLLIAGCATLGPNFSGIRPKSNNKAIIYAYRSKVFTGAARSPDILLNEKKIGTLPNGGYFSVEVDPGPSKVAMGNFAGEKTSEFQVNLRAGEIYFLRMDLSLPGFRENVNPTGQSTGEKCPFMGLNVMIQPSDKEVLGVLKNIDKRVQSSTCSAGMLFVAEELALREMANTKLSPQ